MAAAAGGREGLKVWLEALPLLTTRDRLGVLKLVTSLDLDDMALVARSNGGVSIWRTARAGHANIVRVTGCGEVAEDPRVVFSMLSNLELIPEYDMLFKSARYLSFVRDPAGRVEVAYIHLVYGLPGVSHLVSDRDFVLRVTRVFLPTGFVLHCRSVAPDEHVPGDPGPQPRMIRGWMADSGYVVLPAAGGCCVSVSLQVDPKGWVPTAIVNWSLEALPLNITRMRSTLARLHPAVRADLHSGFSNSLQAAACTKLPPRHTLGAWPSGLPPPPGSAAGPPVAACGAASCGDGSSGAGSSCGNSWRGSGSGSGEEEEEASEWFDA